MDTVYNRIKRDTALGVSLRVEKNFGVNHVVLLTTQQIGPGEIEKILFLYQYIGALVVNVQKRLQVREFISFANFGLGLERNANLITLRQLEQEIGFECSFNMKMELYLG